MRALKTRDLPMKDVMDIATILWHLKTLTEELESLSQPVKRLATG